MLFALLWTNICLNSKMNVIYSGRYTKHKAHSHFSFGNEFIQILIFNFLNILNYLMTIFPVIFIIEIQLEI